MSGHRVTTLPWMMPRPLAWRGWREPRGGRRRCERLRRRSGWGRRCGSPVWSAGPGSGRQPDPETLLLGG